MRNEVAPKNILMIGPTGVGKTEIARRLATLTGAPFIKVEATKYTEVGYYGRDVESMVRELVENAIGLVREKELERVKPEAERRVESVFLNAAAYAAVIEVRKLTDGAGTEGTGSMRVRGQRFPARKAEDPCPVGDGDSTSGADRRVQELAHPTDKFPAQARDHGEPSAKEANSRDDSIMTTGERRCKNPIGHGGRGASDLRTQPFG